MSKPKNTLIIMSDEHSRKVLGAYGNAFVHSPNLDALAARGTTFEAAYCNSPICVPSRASFHTGLYTHKTRLWDNAMPYAGQPTGWAHWLNDAGHKCSSIGKLHFKDSACATGFAEEILPLHVQDGIGDPSTLLRKNPPPRPGTKKLSAMTAQGVSPYWDYDSAVAETSVEWIRENSKQAGWTLFVSLVLPHFPLNAPKEFRDLYDREKLPLPKLSSKWQTENATTGGMRALLDFQDHFQDEKQIREAIAHYYALVSALDHNVGQVLQALETSGAAEDTLVIYASDHGDNLGARGFWGKSTLWEEAVGIPLILAGPGIPEGKKSRTPVTLVDLAPTLLSAAEIEGHEELPGVDLASIANMPDQNRSAFAEYHAVGSSTGMFMLRDQRFKLIESVGDSPLLYDLDKDPEELVNLASDRNYAEHLAECRRKLQAICDPEAVSQQAFIDQQARVDELGGEAVIRQHQPVAYTHPGVAMEPQRTK